MGQRESNTGWSNGIDDPIITDTGSVQKYLLAEEKPDELVNEMIFLLHGQVH